MEKSNYKLVFFMILSQEKKLLWKKLIGELLAAGM
jgi:hypothetical protein